VGTHSMIKLFGLVVPPQREFDFVAFAADGLTGLIATILIFPLAFLCQLAGINTFNFIEPWIPISGAIWLLAGVVRSGDKSRSVWIVALYMNALLALVGCASASAGVLVLLPFAIPANALGIAIGRRWRRSSAK